MRTTFLTLAYLALFCQAMSPAKPRGHGQPVSPPDIPDLLCCSKVPSCNNDPKCCLKNARAGEACKNSMPGKTWYVGTREQYHNISCPPRCELHSSCSPLYSIWRFAKALAHPHRQSEATNPNLDLNAALRYRDVTIIQTVALKAEKSTIRNLVASYDWVFLKLGSQECMPRPACEYLERGLGAIWTIDGDYVGKSYRGTLYPLRIYGLKCEKGERGGGGGGRGGDEEGERRE
ncbi:hypothetical protein SMMN14_02489, partial [Sphaerulina musiva]